MVFRRQAGYRSGYVQVDRQDAARGQNQGPGEVWLIKVLCERQAAAELAVLWRPKASQVCTVTLSPSSRPSSIEVWPWLMRVLMVKVRNDLVGMDQVVGRFISRVIIANPLNSVSQAWASTAYPTGV